MICSTLLLGFRTSFYLWISAVLLRNIKVQIFFFYLDCSQYFSCFCGLLFHKFWKIIQILPYLYILYYVPPDTIIRFISFLILPSKSINIFLSRSVINIHLPVSLCCILDNFFYSPILFSLVSNHILFINSFH